MGPSNAMMTFTSTIYYTTFIDTGATLGGALDDRPIGLRPRLDADDLLNDLRVYGHGGSPFALPAPLPANINAIHQSLFL